MSPANKSAAADAPAPSSDSPLDGPISAEERWQLMLGADEELGGLRGSLQAMDRALGTLYAHQKVRYKGGAAATPKRHRLLRPRRQMRL